MLLMRTTKASIKPQKVAHPGMYCIQVPATYVLYFTKNINNKITKRDNEFSSTLSFHGMWGA